MSIRRTCAAGLGSLSSVISRLCCPESPSRQRSRQLRWWSEHWEVHRRSSSPSCLLRHGTSCSEVTYRGELRSPATVKRYLAVLSHAFSVAVRSGAGLRITRWSG